MSTASKWIVTTAVLSLASLPALGATSVFEFDSSKVSQPVEYPSGKGYGYIQGTEDYTGVQITWNAGDYNMKYGNHPFRATDGSVQQTGLRDYSETMPLTGPALGLNVATPPLVVGAASAPTFTLQTMSGYTGPEVYGGYATRLSSETTATNLVNGPFVNYQSKIATTAGTTNMYFSTGLNNNINSAYTDPLMYDELRVKVDIGTEGNKSENIGTIRVIEAALLALGQVDSATGFDADSKIDFVIGAPSTNNSRTSTVRAVVKADGQYYISNFFETLAGKNTAGGESLTGVFDFTELSTGTWSTYDPSTSLYYANNAILSPDLSTNITFAGVHITGRAQQSANSTNGSFSNFNMDLRLGAFTVTAIPEPASLALLAIGSALIGFRRQR
ncbi:MAG: PEP-CTERM sorting domain-containing protein [Phycisphaerales bacterium]|nr:PEP-CTERM sorting domain-containing protein [Phycisphaerales bacterium]